jgi:hypothetical protein
MNPEEGASLDGLLSQKKWAASIMRRVLSLKDVLVACLRLLTAFVVGLVSGFLTIRHLYQANWWGYLLLLLPPFVGVIGMVTVGARNEHPSFTGHITTWPAWLGFWLAFLLWEASHLPIIFITFSGCWAAGCDPGYANPPPSELPLPFGTVFLIFFLIFFLRYGIGLVSIEVGIQVVIKYRSRRGDQSRARVRQELSAEDARRQLYLYRTQGRDNRSRYLSPRSRFRR